MGWLRRMMGIQSACPESKGERKERMGTMDCVMRMLRVHRELEMSRIEDREFDERNCPADDFGISIDWEQRERMMIARNADNSIGRR